MTFTCECTPEVLRDPLGVAEFGGEPMDSLRGGLDFENVRSDSDTGCLSTQGDGDVTLLFSDDCRPLGLWPGNWTVSSHAVFSWAWFVDSFMTSPLTARSIQEVNSLSDATPRENYKLQIYRETVDLWEVLQKNVARYSVFKYRKQ